MLAYALTIAAALYLGLATAISPCPLTMNIAAISYVARKVDHPRWVLATGLLFTLGQCLAYVALATVIAATALTISGVSLWLQQTMHIALGPICIVLGVLLTGLLVVPGGSTAMSAAWQRRIDALGIWGAAPLGALLALSFCPTSAAWFFGLMALVLGAQRHAAGGDVAGLLTTLGIEPPREPLPGGVFLLPLAYGLGTGLPVLMVSMLLARSARAMAVMYRAATRVERVARQIAGWLFIALGVYFSLRYAFALF